MSTFKLVALRFDQVIKRNSEGRPIEVVKHRTGGIISGLDRSEAERLLKAGAIVTVDDDADGDADAEREAAEVAANAAAAAAAEAERLAAEDAARQQAQQSQQAQQGQAPTRPKVAAAKPLWEAYAAARGIDVAGMDKDEIITAVDALDAK
ncbi:lipase chaperone [Rhodococcus sp. WS3]|uniref:lipase chaperone n=1 Tax=Rhodococcus sp. WS3 TaxID=2486271 RepID=UPI001143C605|nr:lipase chaperone [Rhodococcus sp. WS3]ROZ49380.1 lipase chaperone [Rhodococcus sp. WS3]